jgi:hypothetical protein
MDNVGCGVSCSIHADVAEGTSNPEILSKLIERRAFCLRWSLEREGLGVLGVLILAVEIDRFITISGEKKLMSQPQLEIFTNGVYL